MIQNDIFWKKEDYSHRSYVFKTITEVPGLAKHYLYYFLALWKKTGICKVSKEVVGYTSEFLAKDISQHLFVGRE